MAKRYRLRELEAAHGDLDKVIPELVNRGGQKLAATTLNTTSATISRWLRTKGYTLRAQWVKEQAT